MGRTVLYWDYPYHYVGHIVGRAKTEFYARGLRIEIDGLHHISGVDPPHHWTKEPARPGEVLVVRFHRARLCSDGHEPSIKSIREEVAAKIDHCERCIEREAEDPDRWKGWKPGMQERLIESWTKRRQEWEAWLKRVSRE